MRMIYGFGLAFGLALTAACMHNGASKPANTTTPPPSHWTAKVCTSVKDEITINAGPSADDTDNFGHWRAGDGQAAYNLPERVQQLSQVFVKASGAPADKVAQMCVLFDGRPKKAFNFSGQSEDHLIKSSDTDDSSCRCR
jgi:hypothetical protein